MLDAIAESAVPLLELELRYVGYQTQVFRLSAWNHEIVMELQLMEPAGIIYFGLRPPLRRRIWWKLASWMRKKIRICKFPVPNSLIWAGKIIEVHPYEGNFQYPERT